MRRIKLTALTLLIAAQLFSQSISVSSFKLLDTDLTANTSGTMEIDQNGETAALIKVVTTEAGFSFDGGTLGIVKTKQTPGEVWVYIPRGAKKISIKHPQLGVLRDYYFPCPIEAARTYEMRLTTGSVETIVRQARASQYVVFQVTPSNAIVELNGELLETTDGIATKLLKFGTYHYRVNAPNYLPEAGNVAINDPEKKHVVNINLKPNFSQITLVVDNEAEIWVNGEQKGVSSWTGNLGPGTYEFESRKTSHRSITNTYDIVVTTEPQTIHLQTPMPILGDADINSSPAMADIYIDNKKVGQTPQIFPNLLIGQHQVRISKTGYEDYSASININEGETAILSAPLQKSPNPINSSEINNVHKQTVNVENISFDMIHVEGGSFMMGNTYNGYGDKYWDKSKPAHIVELSSYYIAETEVTQELWETVMGNNPASFKSKYRPVENVSWEDCQTFIKKLSQITKIKFRLPTEAEWEYAARGGKNSKKYPLSGSDNIEEVAWYANNTKTSTNDVKKKKPNELGIYDMSGNVGEWCIDPWGEYLPKKQVNPIAKGDNRLRVVRGGWWNSFYNSCTVGFRDLCRFDDRRNNIGLRLVADNIE